MLALLAAGTARLAAQSDTTWLTLHDCVRMAREQGPLGSMAMSAWEGKESAYRSFIRGFLPQLSLQGDAPGYTHSINPVVLPDGTTMFIPQSEASSTASLALTQKIPFTGGQLSVLSGLNRIDIMESRTHYYSARPFALSLVQPLFQINTMRWDEEAQELHYRMAPRELAEAMEDCAADVTNKFFDLLLSSMNAANASLNVAVNDTLYRISRGRFNVGKIAENDLLQSELAYLSAKTDYENAVVGLSRSRQTLRAALGMKPGAAIALVPPREIAGGRVDPDSALARARENRSDMLNYDLQLLAAERGVVQARSDNAFGVTMNASIGYNQTAPALPDAYRQLLDQQAVSLGFTFPIFRWGAGSAAVDAALAEQKRTEVSVAQQRFDAEQEVLYEAARLNLLRDQVAVAAKSDTIAQRRFDVAKDRYVIGKIDIPILFIAQSEKDAARRSNIQTLWNYWSTYFRLRRLTLFDFDTGEPLVAGEGAR